MKIPIDVERHDTLEFFSENMVDLGYKAGIAKECREIIRMLSDEQYNDVLTKGGYREIDLDRYIRSEIPSIYIIHIKDSCNPDEDVNSKADLHSFGIPELLQAVESRSSMSHSS
jgi:hypothetical protein